MATAAAAKGVALALRREALESGVLLRCVNSFKIHTDSWFSLRTAQTQSLTGFQLHFNTGVQFYYPHHHHT